MTRFSDGILTEASIVVPQRQSVVIRRRMRKDHQPRSAAMDDMNRTHTLRVCSARSTVDDATLPFNSEQPMFALIRQWSRYILISN
jgi:hypothetical protein